MLTKRLQQIHFPGNYCIEGEQQLDFPSEQIAHWVYKSALTNKSELSVQTPFWGGAKHSISPVALVCFLAVTALIAREGPNLSNTQRASGRSLFMPLLWIHYLVLWHTRCVVAVMCGSVPRSAVSHGALLLANTSLLSAALPITNATDISIVFDVELGDI